MKKIFLIIEIHQPVRLDTYRFYEIMSNQYYYNDYENEFNIKKISEECYIPANRILSDLIHYSRNDFKVSFLFSGIVLDQFELYASEVLDSFEDLVDSGCAELLSGTYSNLFGPVQEEFHSQVKLQNERIRSTFRKTPLPCPFTDLYSYHNRLISNDIRMVIENESLNRHISFKVTFKNQSDWSLRPEKIINLLNAYGKEGYDSIKIFIPYDLFGDSQNKTGILEFLERFPIKVLSKSDFTFVTSPGIKTEYNSGLITKSSPENTVKNSDTFYSSCNALQINAFEKLYSLSDDINKCCDPHIIKDWLYLQACDHFYFMSPELYRNSERQRISLPYSSHFFAYINYMNILTDFSDRLSKWIIDYEKDQNGFYGKGVTFDKNVRGSVFSAGRDRISGNQVNEVKALA
jgi:alpha-amylase